MMKKKILMVGNTNNLPGVTKDMDSYRSFFTSQIGGNWYSDEIEIIPNPSKIRLLAEITKIKNEGYDYVITIFSGHGGQAGNATVLEINRNDTVNINIFRNLSKRQLLIFDCCRATIQPQMIKTASVHNISFSQQRDTIREKYEARILQSSAPQEVILFACGAGESASDTDRGGVYSQYLIYAAQELSQQDNPFVSISEVHVKATDYIKKSNWQQNPQIQICQPRCLTNQRLPFAVNPELVLAINPRHVG